MYKEEYFQNGQGLCVNKTFEMCLLYLIFQIPTYSSQSFQFDLYQIVIGYLQGTSIVIKRLKGFLKGCQGWGVALFEGGIF
jgi:hypothetical protein